MKKQKETPDPVQTVVVLGPKKSGKTTLVNGFSDREFTDLAVHVGLQSERIKRYKQQLQVWEGDHWLLRRLHDRISFAVLTFDCKRVEDLLELHENFWPLLRLPRVLVLGNQRESGEHAEMLENARELFRERAAVQFVDFLDKAALSRALEQFMELAPK